MNILVFSPFARILPHSVPEAGVYSQLRNAGHDVRIISCGQIFQGQCITLDALGLANSDLKTIKKTCAECVSCSKKLFPDAQDIKSILDKTGDDIASKVRSLTKSITAENFADFTYGGLPVGKIAAYQHMINFKKFTPSITEGEFPKFLREAQNCLYVYFALEAFSHTADFKPDLVVTYNSLYGVNAIFCQFFAKNGSRVYSLHAGANLNKALDTILIMNNNTFDYLTTLKAKYIGGGRTALTEDKVTSVLSHFRELASGKSVFAYSKKVDHNKVPDIRSQFNIRKERRIILAAMSSYDERFSAEYCGALGKSKDAVFSTQIDWISWLVKYAKTRDDLHFIIRLHPREFPNKRESVQSQHAMLVIEALKHKPENVCVNIPADNLSLYDIARETDVTLTSWSSVGKELMLLGIPLVLYTADSQWYPPSLAMCASTLEEYESLINDALASGWSVKNSIEVLRWLSFETCDNTFQLTTRLSPARKIRVIDFSRRVAAKIFGPSFLVNSRIGRVIEAKALIAAMETGLTKSEVINESGVTNTSKDLEITLQYLPRLGEIMFGKARSAWPEKFLTMINKSRTLTE